MAWAPCLSRQLACLAMTLVLAGVVVQADSQDDTCDAWFMSRRVECDYCAADLSSCKSICVTSDAQATYAFFQDDGADVADLSGDAPLSITGAGGLVQGDANGFILNTNVTRAAASSKPVSDFAAAATASDEMSIEMWIQYDGIETATLLHVGNSAPACMSAAPVQMIRVDRVGTMLHALIPSSSVTLEAAVPADGELHHVVFSTVPSDDAINRVFTAYLDGQEVDTGLNPFFSLVVPADPNVYLGMGWSTADSCMFESASATVAVLALHAPALTASEVSARQALGPHYFPLDDPHCNTTPPLNLVILALSGLVVLMAFVILFVVPRMGSNSPSLIEVTTAAATKAGDDAPGAENGAAAADPAAPPPVPPRVHAGEEDDGSLPPPPPQVVEPESATDILRKHAESVGGRPPSSQGSASLQVGRGGSRRRSRNSKNSQDPSGKPQRVPLISEIVEERVSQSGRSRRGRGGSGRRGGGQGGSGSVRRGGGSSNRIGRSDSAPSARGRAGRGRGKGSMRRKKDPKWEAVPISALGGSAEPNQQADNGVIVYDEIDDMAAPDI